MLQQLRSNLTEKILPEREGLAEDQEVCVQAGTTEANDFIRRRSPETRKMEQDVSNCPLETLFYWRQSQMQFD